MRIQLRNKYLSLPRYNRYLAATGNDNVRAERLYTGNIKLAQAFHPILSQFEVIFRNALCVQMSSHFSDPDWIINEKSGFMSHASLRFSNYFMRNSVQNVENSLIRRRIAITSGKVISDQNFGFWIAFFLRHHYTLIRGQSLYVFPNKPRIEDRASIYSKLDDIRNFRNRINHCEPICFTHNNIDCSVAIDIKNKLYNLIEWIDPDLVPFFTSLDNTTNEIINITTV